MLHTHSKMKEEPADSMEPKKVKRSLLLMVDIVSAVIAILILFYIAYYHFGLISYPSDSFTVLWKYNIADCCRILIFYLGAHLLSWAMFHNTISKLDMDLTSEFLAKGETVFLRTTMAVLILIILAVPLARILIYGKMIPFSVFEIVLFLTLWYVVIKRNKRTGYKLSRVLITAFIQLVMVSIFPLF